MNKTFLIFLFFLVIIPFALSKFFGETTSGKLINTNSNRVANTQTITRKELDGLAMNILKEAERHNNAGMQPYFNEMLKKGVTAVTSPQVAVKRTPQCPPIEMELNGRMIKGSLCARMSYEYKGKDYWVGYCK